MELLYWFESIRTPFLDQLMALASHLGEETFFIAAVLVVYWCVDKRQGCYLLTVGFTGTVANQWLKIACRVPRPWVRDPDFTIVESARERAAGYSFPSGHTQTAVGFFGGLARWNQQRWLRIACVLAALLVAVSRMYLGVHTPADVGVSLLLGAALVFGLYPAMRKAVQSPRRMIQIFVLLLAVGIGFILFVEIFPFPAGTDAANLAAAVKNAYSLTGALAGMLAAYLLDQRYVRFSTAAPWWGQLVKVAGGLALTLAVKAVLKAPLLSLLGGHHAADAIRYFMVVLTAGGLWPWTFRFFGSREKH